MVAVATVEAESDMPVESPTPALLALLQDIIINEVIIKREIADLTEVMVGIRD